MFYGRRGREHTGQNTLDFGVGQPQARACSRTESNGEVCGSWSQYVTGQQDLTGHLGGRPGASAVTRPPGWLRLVTDQYDLVGIRNAHRVGVI